MRSTGAMKPGRYCLEFPILSSVTFTPRTLCCHAQAFLSLVRSEPTSAQPAVLASTRSRFACKRVHHMGSRMTQTSRLGQAQHIRAGAWVELMREKSTSTPHPPARETASLLRCATEAILWLLRLPTEVSCGSYDCTSYNRHLGLAMIPTTATPMTRPHCTVLWDSCPPFLPSGPAVCECLGVATVLCSQRCVFVS